MQVDPICVFNSEINDHMQGFKTLQNGKGFTQDCRQYGGREKHRHICSGALLAMRSYLLCSVVNSFAALATPIFDSSVRPPTKSF